MTPTPVRVGIVGAGDNTRKKHIPGLRAIPGVEIAAVARVEGAADAGRDGDLAAFDH